MLWIHYFIPFSTAFIDGCRCCHRFGSYLVTGKFLFKFGKIYFKKLFQSVCIFRVHFDVVVTGSVDPGRFNWEIESVVKLATVIDINDFIIRSMNNESGTFNPGNFINTRKERNQRISEKKPSLYYHTKLSSDTFQINQQYNVIVNDILAFSLLENIEIRYSPGGKQSHVIFKDYVIK